MKDIKTHLKTEQIDWNEVLITWLMFTDRHTHTVTSQT